MYTAAMRGFMSASPPGAELTAFPRAPYLAFGNM
jgi:hypothetical protein